MTDDKATPDDVRAALEKAFEAGRQAGASEQPPERFRFSNGQYGSARGNLEQYEAAISAKTYELRGKGVRNIKGHPDIAEIMREFGRA